jgi:hypothetical protein
MRKTLTGRKPKIQLLPGDKEAVDQLREAMAATEDLPYEDQWTMTMELLPDEFLAHVIRARNRQSSDAAISLAALLALAVLEEWWDDEEEPPDPEALPAAMYGILMSVYAEMERRHKHFCDEVLHMTDPLDPSEPVHYIPRDPETFSENTLFQYYQDLLSPAPQDSKS